MANDACSKCGTVYEYIYTPYIRKGGKVIYRKNGGKFRIPICACNARKAA